MEHAFEWFVLFAPWIWGCATVVLLAARVGKTRPQFILSLVGVGGSLLLSYVYPRSYSANPAYSFLVALSILSLVAGLERLAFFYRRGDVARRARRTGAAFATCFVSMFISYFVSRLAGQALGLVIFSGAVVGMVMLIPLTHELLRQTYRGVEQIESDDYSL